MRRRAKEARATSYCAPLAGAQAGKRAGRGAGRQGVVQAGRRASRRATQARRQGAQAGAQAGGAGKGAGRRAGRVWRQCAAASRRNGHRGLVARIKRCRAWAAASTTQAGWRLARDVRGTVSHERCKGHNLARVRPGTCDLAQQAGRQAA